MHRGSEFNLPIRSARERPNPDSAFHRTASRGPPASLPHPDRPVKDRLRWRASVGHFTLWGISFTEGAHPACSASHARGEIQETSAAESSPSGSAESGPSNRGEWTHELPVGRLAPPAGHQLSDDSRKNKSRLRPYIHRIVTSAALLRHAFPIPSRLKWWIHGESSGRGSLSNPPVLHFRQGERLGNPKVACTAF